MWKPAPNNLPSAAPADRRTAHALLVEDHLLEARRVLAEFLEANGYRTTIANLMEEAGALLFGGGLRFNVVLLDLMLPGSGGEELLRAIRQQPPPVGTVPVVVLSSFVPLTLTGADAVLPKPVDFAVLLNVLRRALALHRSATAR